MLHSKAHAQGAAPAPSALATLPASRLAAEWKGPARVGQLQLRLIVLGAERGVVAAALTVGAPHCSGGLDSLGQWQQGTLVLQPYRPDPETEACEVRVRVDARGGRPSLGVGNRLWSLSRGWLHVRRDTTGTVNVNDLQQTKRHVPQCISHYLVPYHAPAQLNVVRYGKGSVIAPPSPFRFSSLHPS